LGDLRGIRAETKLTAFRPHPSARLQIMSVQTLFDILLVLVAVFVLWFASFVVLRLFKGQD
jgi:hypothetical protein